jgi:GT2 family glycosyltransferase
VNISAGTPGSLTATVVVTTRNRRDDLRICLQSAVNQSPLPEIIVVDDASDDGTVAMIEAEFPQVILLRHVEMQGYIVGRNEASRRATGSVIVSIDDDAAFSSPAIVRDTLRHFDDPRVGAVAIPYIDVHRGPQVKQRAPDADRVFVSNTFIGTAHAVRRDVFARVGGYREYLFHQGEESDFCIRMLAAGYVVRLGSSDPIHHFESPRRDFRRMDHFGPRNALLFIHQNVPLPDALARSLATSVQLMLWSLAPSRLMTRLRGITAGLSAMRRYPRQPVDRRAYQLWRRLQTHTPITLSDVAGQLPPSHA